MEPNAAGGASRETPRTGAPRPVRCPFCDSGDTEMLSPFGGQLSVAQYWCRGCRTGFDYLKWEDTGSAR